MYDTKTETYIEQAIAKRQKEMEKATSFTRQVELYNEIQELRRILALRNKNK